MSPRRLPEYDGVTYTGCVLRALTYRCRVPRSIALIPSRILTAVEYCADNRVPIYAKAKETSNKRLGQIYGMSIKRTLRTLVLMGSPESRFRCLRGSLAPSVPQHHHPAVLKTPQCWRLLPHSANAEQWGDKIW